MMGVITCIHILAQFLDNLLVQVRFSVLLMCKLKGKTKLTAMKCAMVKLMSDKIYIYIV